VDAGTTGATTGSGAGTCVRCAGSLTAFFVLRLVAVAARLPVKLAFAGFVRAVFDFAAFFDRVIPGFGLAASIFFAGNFFTAFLAGFGAFCTVFFDFSFDFAAAGALCAVTGAFFCARSAAFSLAFRAFFSACLDSFKAFFSAFLAFFSARFAALAAFFSAFLASFSACSFALAFFPIVTPTESLEIDAHHGSAHAPLPKILRLIGRSV
jgi:hypothetical protein